jgi:hypothetical protein
MKIILKIIFRTCILVAAISLIPFIFLTADYNPAWSQYLPFLGAFSLICLILAPLWTIYYLIVYAVEKRWRLFTCILVGLALVVIATILSIQTLSKKAVLRADKIALTVLTKNSLGYDVIVENEAKKDFNLFLHEYDGAAIQRMNALPQYKRYDYIVMPKSSPAFLMTIIGDEKKVHISNRGIDNYLKDRKLFKTLNRSPTG